MWLPAARCLRDRRTLPVCTAYSSNPARRRRRPISIHSVRVHRLRHFRRPAKSESEGFEPEGGDQEAKLLDLVLQLVATTSTIRGLRHPVQVVATFAERVRGLASLGGCIFATWASVGRLVTSAYRLDAAATRFSMVRMDLRVCDALARVCVRHRWQRTACGCRKCVCVDACISGRRACL